MFFIIFQHLPNYETYKCFFFHVEKMTTWNRDWMLCMLHAAKRMLQCRMLMCDFVACSMPHCRFVWSGLYSDNQYSNFSDRSCYFCGACLCWRGDAKDIHASEKYQVEIPAKIKKEIGLYAKDFGTASAIEKFTTKYPKYSFIGTTVNTWKKKCNDGDWTVIKRIRRPNLLDSCMLKKLKTLYWEQGWLRGVINRC